LKLIFPGLLAALPCLLGCNAAAQSAPIEFGSDIEAVTVIAPGHETSAATDSEDVLYEVTLDSRAETVLQNGLQIGGRVTLRGQRDHPARPGFVGHFGGAPGPSGAYSGLSGRPGRQETGARGSLEAAYLELGGGYGELRFGRDRGVASRFHEGAPSALTHAGINNPYLDPNGIKILRTNHDLTGPSAKVSYATPRILGLRAGVSVTPEGEAKGLDRNVDRGGLQPELSNAVEAAANLSRRLPRSGIRIEAALAWSRADSDLPAPLARDSVETWSAGANVELSGVTLGGSWLSSDNGVRDGDYEAWEIGAGFGAWETDFSVNYGEADDSLAVSSSEAFSIAASREIADSLRMALAWQDESLSGAGTKYTGSGVVVEITLASSFLSFAGN